MCKYCEKKIEIKKEYKWVGKKHPQLRCVEEKVAHNPLWLEEEVEIEYSAPEYVPVYLDVDKKKLNGKIEINYCPFCGRKL